MTNFTQREHHEFIAAAEEALHDANLQLALSRLGETLGQRNKDAFDQSLQCTSSEGGIG